MGTAVTTLSLWWFGIRIRIFAYRCQIARIFGLPYPYLDVTEEEQRAILEMAAEIGGETGRMWIALVANAEEIES